MNRNIILNEISEGLLAEVNKIKVPATWTDLIKLESNYPEDQINFTDDKKIDLQYKELAERIKLYN